MNPAAVAEARKPQAKDITDGMMLDAIRQAITGKNAEELVNPPGWLTALHLQPGVWTTASRWEVGAALGEQWPEKVVLAKLRSMERRKLVDGCPCGCRGDFSIIEDRA